MKIGIMVHSRTGNSLAVAQKLEKKLSEAGHSVKLERIAALDDNIMEADKIQLKNIPDINEYDALIFGGPVRGFSFSPVMSAYIKKIGSLQGKMIACFVTQAFPFPAMGGRQAIKQAVALCVAHGAKVSETGIINRTNIHCKKMIEDLVERFSTIF